MRTRKDMCRRFLMPSDNVLLMHWDHGRKSTYEIAEFFKLPEAMIERQLRRLRDRRRQDENA